MYGLADLPVALRRYLLLVIAGGLVAAGLPLALDPAGITRLDPWRALIVVVMAVAAERVTIHLTHKTAVSPVTACFLALVLICPMPAAGALALAAGLAGQLLRHHRDPIEAAFNAGQGALSVCVAAVVAFVLHGVGPSIEGIGLATLAAGGTMHVINTVLVALAAAFHLGRPPLRVLLVHLREEIAPHAAMLALGFTLWHLVAESPLLAIPLVVPLWLVRASMRQTVQLRDDTHAALATLVEVVELRDPYTAGHSHRVADLAHALALGLGLTQEEADLIAGAGRVHDVGKVAIDPAVLTKPGKLTDAEVDEMRRHPVLGADVVARFGVYQAGVPLVRHHHEAWDGSGYPDGLKEEAIPLGARILAVADTFDALTSDRPYRNGMDLSRATDILRDGAGKQWDADVVEVLLVYLGVPLREAAARRVGALSVAAA